MAEESDDLDNVVRTAIGHEMRRARDAVGWTRAELVARLPFDLHTQTLAGYERGAVQCASSRFVLLCQAMGVSAPDILAWAMQRALIDLPTTGVQVDVHAVVHDNAPDLLPLRRWARKLLKDDPGSGVARLAWPAVQELARAFGMDRDAFVRILVRFTPRPVPQRR